MVKHKAEQTQTAVVGAAVQAGVVVVRRFELGCSVWLITRKCTFVFHVCTTLEKLLSVAVA